MINHGKEILKDLRRRTFWGKVKSKISYIFWFVVMAGSVSVFVFAGFLSTSILVQMATGQLI